jgi:hypothetical protein
MTEKEIKTLIDQCSKEALSLAFSTVQCTLEQITPIINNVYRKMLGINPPGNILLARSPVEAWRLFSKFTSCSLPYWPELDGHWSAHKHAVYKVYRLLGLDAQTTEWIKTFESTTVMDVIYAKAKICVVSNNPTQIERTENRTHVLYADGFEVFVKDGKRVSKELWA